MPINRDLPIFHSGANAQWVPPEEEPTPLEKAAEMEAKLKVPKTGGVPRDATLVVGDDGVVRDVTVRDDPDVGKDGPKESAPLPRGGIRDADKPGERK